MNKYRVIDRNGYAVDVEADYFEVDRVPEHGMVYLTLYIEDGMVASFPQYVSCCKVAE